MQVYQDMAFPLECLQTMLDAIHTKFTIYPIMCYPCKIYTDKGGFIRHNHNDTPNSTTKQQQQQHDHNYQYFLNLGIYGVPLLLEKGDPTFKTVSAVRQLEQLVRTVGGFQHTYCDTFQTEEEFRTMFHHKLWDNCRHKYKCHGNFPTIYEKVKANDIIISVEE